ncbi:MAG TPA: Ldh family oxidoreductase [Amaricoccus sp.]|uniref:Ldh family oxidoreductase n=1 Tax=Amaricoccus sp. TaxID=1872485 RepID=UPI002C94DC8F|nr:Ldh family oxidoreductase [Amaricoccus sp.]HMR34225.1 Ldh family oxidoreductase [Geminicoccus sp.]HMU00781.1 Ldh family oxidoreductase [Amaricoccus sp.]
MPRLTEAEAKRFALAVLTASGLSGEDAESVADGLVEATKRGVSTHGIFRLPQYSESLRAGRIEKAPKVGVIARRGCTAIVDAGGGYGFRPTRIAADLGIEIARENGIAIVGVRNSHHFGAAATYAKRPAAAGMIGIVTTTTKARIAPTGAKGPVVGNNPIAIAVPRRAPHRPVLLDMALSQVAMGRIRIAAANGQQVPEGWGYDAGGRPTTDPHAILNGLLAAIGEYKGYGLSVMVELLAGALTGSPFGLTADNHDHPKGGVGHLVIVIAVDFMRDMEAFLDDVETLVRDVHASPKAEGTQEVFLPGEIEDRKVDEAERLGLLVSDELRAQLAYLAETLKIEPPRYSS